MAGELQPTMGDIRPHGHLKMGRFTQHFIDVLDLNLTPLEFFEQQYPNDPREEQRKYLGRFGVSGRMQVQRMAELSDGQKSRVVFAKLGRDVPHILLLGESPCCDCRCSVVAQTPHIASIFSLVPSGFFLMILLALQTNPQTILVSQSGWYLPRSVVGWAIEGIVSFGFVLQN